MDDASGSHTMGMMGPVRYLGPEDSQSSSLVYSEFNVRQRGPTLFG